MAASEERWARGSGSGSGLRLAGVMRAVVALCVCLTVAGCSSVGGSVPLGEAMALRGERFERGVVAADHTAASEAGAEILRRGGNAVDAAVATAFALSVVRPESCGIGGGGFMLVRLAAGGGDPARTVAIDYRERAPMAVDAGVFSGPDAPSSREGGMAVATPGTVAGLLHALERYGTMSRSEVMGPAIRLATEGYAADGYTIETMERLRAQADPGAEGSVASWVSGARAGGELPWEAVWRVFLRDGALRSGETLTNRRQAVVLEEIAERGRSGFYGGRVARAMVGAVQSAGGVMDESDLAEYEVVERDAIEVGFGGYRWLLMPPPSSGGVAIGQTLAVLSAYDEQMRGHVGEGPLDAASPADPVFAHALVESLKHAFADRSRFLADPDFVDVAVEMLTSAEYAWSLAERLHPERTQALDRYGDGSGGGAADGGGTSHFSVVDRWGNAVACTETINLRFGSRVVVPGYGFVLNNQMDDFTREAGVENAFGLVQSESNLPGAGKRPLSSMSPTVVLDGEGSVVAVAGASGGPRIITATLQALLNALHFRMSAPDAVEQPRLHHQWLPEVLYAEPPLYRRGGFAAPMRDRGHALERSEDLGAVQLIVRGADGSGWRAASDPRKGGGAAGD